MKKREKQKLINYAIGEYKEIFNYDYKLANLSQKSLKTLLKRYRHSTMTEWKYCCRGLYDCCWQELYADGIWHMSQKRVDKIIEETLRDLAKSCRRDGRIAICEKDGEIHILIVARDLKYFAADYLILLTNTEW